MGIQSENALSEAYIMIESCEMEKAAALLDDTLAGDLDNDSLVFAIQCCNFWKSTLPQLAQSGYFERGETLVNQWKQFMQLASREDGKQERTLYAFRKGIFSLALEFYGKASDEKDDKLHSEICRKKGLCYKKLGSYEVALKCLTEANTSVPGQSSVMAEMADCYALCGETKYAKLLFKEAFFIDAQKIDLDFLDSQLITLLVKKVSEKGYSGAVLQEWIPVYGVLFGVFTVKRKLRSQEVLGLKQEIFAKKSELKDPNNNSSVIIPRLMNLYFWLIDHYQLSKDSVSKINDVMLEIRTLDPAVYKIFVQ